MSRLYLSISFLFLAIQVSGQNNITRYLDFAQEQFDKGDYYYALEYYKKAMEIDSNSIDIVWKLAETYRAYKEYRKAEFYYARVYEQGEAKIHPASLLYLGLMQKQNGKYTEAIQTFKRAKKKYAKQKKSYLYQKSSRELSSTVWAKSASADTSNVSLVHLPRTVNSENSEFGHGIYHGELIFSSLRADSINNAEEVYTSDYRTHLYRSQKRAGDFESAVPLRDLFEHKRSSGNGVYSLDGTRFYFSRCDDQGFTYSCKIMVAQYKNGSWHSIDSLGSIINQPGTNTTMPCIAEIKGQETLIFASDRTEGKGGLDLFYSAIKNGNQYSKVRSIKALNSADNEVTPWWDSAQKRLYFSSSWHNGFGGYDIFYSSYKDGFLPPINVGIPINSAANDLYYFQEADTSYFTSNRYGVLYSKNPTCCSDIFAAKPPFESLPVTKEETLDDLNRRLPVTLYFHNDIPNPKSRDTTTSLSYMSTYREYSAMLKKYQQEYARGLNREKAQEAQEDIENFFIEYVDQGVHDLKLFLKLLLDELHRGARINITVKGFASPLAKTDYNVNLTKRRISSLVNHLREYEDGIFLQYLNGTAMNGGKVVFSQVPFGEYTADQLTSDNPNDVRNSVYSRSAAIERKIEIQSVSYIKEGTSFPLITESPLIDMGVQKNGELLEGTFIVKNVSTSQIQLKSTIRASCACASATPSKRTLAPGETARIVMKMNTQDFKGFHVESVYVGVEGEKKELRLYMSTQLE